jgi:hypothetical protein
MRFLVLLASEDHFDTWDNADDSLRERVIEDYNAFGNAVRQRGTLIVGDALHRPERARTLRPSAGRMVTDGPFAEAKEQIGGFYVIDVPDHGRRARGVAPAGVHRRGPTHARNHRLNLIESSGVSLLEDVVLRRRCAGVVARECLMGMTENPKARRPPWPRATRCEAGQERRPGGRSSGSGRQPEIPSSRERARPSAGAATSDWR